MLPHAQLQSVGLPDYLSVSLYFLQLAGAAFIAIGFWAWSEKVGEYQDIINILLSCWGTDIGNGSLLVFCV